MIEVDRLTKYFGPVPAVVDVSFRVEKGEIIGFLGPNGAGKTTTIRMLNGFFPPTSGSARINFFCRLSEFANLSDEMRSEKESTTFLRC